MGLPIGDVFAFSFQAIRRARRNSGYTGAGLEDVAVHTDVDEFLSTLTGTNMTYLAPERLNFAPAAKTSDIWAFGCLMYEICTGKRPWLQLKKMDDIIRAVPKSHHPLLVPLLKRTLQQKPRHRATSRQILKYVCNASSSAGGRAFCFWARVPGRTYTRTPAGCLSVCSVERVHAHVWCH